MSPEAQAGWSFVVGLFQFGVFIFAVVWMIMIAVRLRYVTRAIYRLHDALADYVNKTTPTLRYSEAPQSRPATWRGVLDRKPPSET